MKLLQILTSKKEINNEEPKEVKPRAKRASKKNNIVVEDVKPVIEEPIQPIEEPIQTVEEPIQPVEEVKTKPKTKITSKKNIVVEPIEEVEEPIQPVEEVKPKKELLKRIILQLKILNQLKNQLNQLKNQKI